MTKFLAATAFGFALTFALPVMAADATSCQASWAKMDAKNTGYVMSAEHKEHMDMMTKAGIKMMAADRISAKEYMDACLANVYEAGKR
jgi:hypothetical protein